MLGTIAAIVCGLCVLARIYFVWSLKQKQTIYGTERAAFQLAKGEAQMHIERLKQVTAEKKQLVARRDLVQQDIQRLEDIQQQFVDRDQKEADKAAKQKAMLDKRQKF